MREMIDRNDEAEILRQAVASAPSLVVLIGRRRVGKSFLLARTIDHRRVVSFQGDEQGERQHLDLLAEEAGRTLLGSAALRFDDWDAALRLLGEQARSEPLTVVLDEFQWLKAAQPALDSIIQRHWDAWDRDGVPITLILSGSALTLMERLMERGAPLYGRASARPRLAPLDYRDAAAFAETTDAEQRLRRWAVVGGTPQYNLWAGRGKVDAVIRRVLSKDGPLYDDPRHLLREGEGIRDPGTYLAILRAVAGGSTSHNEIAQKAGVTSSNLRGKLDRLEDLGYIAPAAPLAPGGGETRSIYQLADPYFRFWFRYVARNRSRLELGRIDEVFAEVSADLDNLMGPSFEECCRTWLGKYAAEELTGAPEQIGRWWSRDGRTEVDVVGVRRHRCVLLGACKWRRIADTDVLGDLLAQQEALGPKAADATLVIFAREGFTEQMRSRAGEHDVRLLTAADLFAPA
jgi:AAA+ ATPase superfamily predicted ATPase